MVVLNCTSAELDTYMKNLRKGYLPCHDSEPFISSQGLEEGFLPISPSVTSASAPSKLIRIASRSSQQGKQTVSFPGFQFSMMLEPLTEPPGTDLLTSSQEGSPARTSPARVKVKASEETDQDFGDKWQESSVRLSLLLCSLKTAHSCEDEDSISSYQICPFWGTMRSGVVFQRKTLERPIKGTGSGLWPTPAADESQPTEEFIREMRESTKATHERLYMPGRKWHSQRTLSRVVHVWPTVRASDADRGGRGDLLQAVRGNENSHFKMQDRLMFPTPVDASKGGGSSRSGNRINEIPSLQGMARAGRWPTPTRRDWKNGKASQATHNKNSRPLNEAVVKWPTPQANDSRTPCFSGSKRAKGMLPTIVGGSLNPDWVELLMGWPLGWTSLSAMYEEDIYAWSTTAGFWGSDWEQDVPRTTLDRDSRVDRLKAIGNGQVSLAAVVAWEFLTRNLIFF